MADTTGKRRNVTVTWGVFGSGPRTNYAVLIDGYSTEADLPRILGIRYGFPSDAIGIMSVEDREITA